VTSSIPTDQQILGALECSGFLFEQEVATTLESSGFHVETSWAYLDPDMEKSREIDLRAVKNVLNDEQLGLQVFVELLVECKNSDSPLVFLERPKNKRELEAPQPREYVFARHTNIRWALTAIARCQHSFTSISQAHTTISEMTGKLRNSQRLFGRVASG